MDNNLTDLVYSAWVRERSAERPRTYLGASVCGHECDMKLWLDFRGVTHEVFDGRMYRLFDRGQREEQVFVDDLRRIGCEVRDRDDRTGSQFSVSALGGHFSGHLDAICRGVPGNDKEWYVCEFKTHSDASFKKLRKDGVRKAKPMHFFQMQVYMGLTGLKKALYMAVDKDDDSLYTEILDFDKGQFDYIMNRSSQIIESCDPQRCAKRPDDFRCKACSCRSVCWHLADQTIDPNLPMTCRTCCHATAEQVADGACWSCRKGHSCSCDKTGCEDHLVLPVFVKAEIVGGNEDTITYRTNGGCEFKIGKGSLITVEELKMMAPDNIETILKVKDAVPTATVVSSNSLQVKYGNKERFSTYDECPITEAADKCSTFIQDISKPLRSETVGDEQFFEYDLDICIVINKRSGIARIICENPPF